MSGVTTNMKVKMLTVGAVCVALAFILNQMALFRMPMGGSVTVFSMLFVVLAGYWLGAGYGVIVGVALGFLNLITGPYILHPVQFIVDYPLAYGALGLSGLFRKQKYGLPIGYVVGVLGRYAMVFFSGYLFFAAFAPEGQHPALYSAIYNITYIAPEMIVTLVIISLPSIRHAIDVVTKSVVTHDDYVEITKNQGGSITAKARLVTGAVMGALGGFAFVLVLYITRLETLSIMHHAMGVDLFTEAPSRLYRMIERNTGHIFTLQVVGVLFLALGVGLLFSVLLRED